MIFKVLVRKIMGGGCRKVWAHFLPAPENFGDHTAWQNCSCHGLPGPLDTYNYCFSFVVIFTYLLSHSFLEVYCWRVTSITKV